MSVGMGLMEDLQVSVAVGLDGGPAGECGGGA